MVFRVNLPGLGEGNFQKLGESGRVWRIFWGGRGAITFHFMFITKF